MVNRIVSEINDKSNCEFAVMELLSNSNNRVFRLFSNKKSYALKIYNKKNGTKEAKVIEAFREKEVLMPQVYVATDEYLLMDYIDGRKLSDLVCDEITDLSWIDSLVAKLSYIHDKTALVPDFVIGPSDYSLDNILFADKAIYIIDWEEIVVEKCEDQLGRLFGNILAHDEPFSDLKLKIVRRFLDKYQAKLLSDIDIHLVEIATYDTLERLASENKKMLLKLEDHLRNRYEFKIFT